GVTARSTAATADATAPPRSAASGGRRTAVHTAARNVSGVTSPASDAVTQSGSRPGRRSAIWAASTDLPIPPTPCTTRAASADPASSADQRRRSADRSGSAGDGGGPDWLALAWRPYPASRTTSASGPSSSSGPAGRPSGRKDNE